MFGSQTLKFPLLVAAGTVNKLLHNKL